MHTVLRRVVGLGMIIREVTFLDHHLPQNHPRLVPANDRVLGVRLAVHETMGGPLREWLVAYITLEGHFSLLRLLGVWSGRQEATHWECLVCHVHKQTFFGSHRCSYIGTK